METRMTEMSQEELDELFRSSPSGDIPEGRTDGTLIVLPGTRMAGVAARLAHLVAWKGKVFDPTRAELRNRLTALGVEGVRAKVYKGPSRFDGKECIVLDYSKTSLVARWLRDEIRQVGPGLYLGFAFCGNSRLLAFVLEVPAR